MIFIYEAGKGKQIFDVFDTAKEYKLFGAIMINNFNQSITDSDVPEIYLDKDFDRFGTIKEGLEILGYVTEVK